MSQNFYALLETRELNALLVPEIVWESFNDLLSLIDTEEDLNKLYEYSELLRNKQLKKSLEIEISEALTPLLEKNTILYGSFLYDTVPLTESCCESSQSTLAHLRELLGSQFIAEAVSPKRVVNLKRAGKIAAGVGAAGLAGAGGLYALGRGQLDSGDGIKSTIKAGYNRAVDTLSGEGGTGHINRKIAELEAERDQLTGGSSLVFGREKNAKLTNLDHQIAVLRNQLKK